MSSSFIAAALARFAVEVNERAKPMKIASNDGHHERKTQSAGTYKRLWCAADAEPSPVVVRERNPGR